MGISLVILCVVGYIAIAGIINAILDYDHISEYNDAIVNPSSFSEASTTGVPYILFYC